MASRINNIAARISIVRRQHRSRAAKRNERTLRVDMLGGTTKRAASYLRAAKRKSGENKRNIEESEWRARLCTRRAAGRRASSVEGGGNQSAQSAPLRPKHGRAMDEASAWQYRGAAYPQHGCPLLLAPHILWLINES